MRGVVARLLAAAALCGVTYAPALAEASQRPAIVQPARRSGSTARQDLDLDDGSLRVAPFVAAYCASFPQPGSPTGALRIRRAAAKRRNQARHRVNCRRAC